jgi:hypothetical protein
MAISRSKRIRGRRARLKQRPRSRDLRDQYREGDLPNASGLVVATIEDPYGAGGHIDASGNIDATARLERFRRADGSLSEGAPGWTPPRRPLVTVIKSLREDPIGRMHARHQISEPQFLAGRGFQECYDTAQIGEIRSVDLQKTKIDGGRFVDPLTDRRLRDAAKLRSVEAAVQRRYGDVGIALARSVLGDRRPVELTARSAGAVSPAEVRSWCWLFRKILDVLAVVLGCATAARSPRPVPITEDDPAADPARHADAAELGNPDLRRGRPNGGG